MKAAIALSFLSLLTLTFQAELKLTIYYETICNSSRRFITQQVYPFFKKLGGLGNPWLEIVFIPYGKANTTFENGEFSYVCQHGNPECLGNKIHACALAYLTEFEAQEFINCTMLITADPNRDAKTCAEDLNIDYTPVQTCYDSWEGDVLLSSHGIYTHNLANPKLYWVPWPLYNGVWKKADMENGEKSVAPVICKKLKAATRPDICKPTIDPHATKKTNKKAKG